MKLMYPLPERAVLLTVPDFAETLLMDIPKGMVPDAPLMIVEISIRRMEQPHTGRDISVPADEAVSLFNEAAPVGAPGHGFSLPGEQLRLLQALLVREKQALLSFREPEHGKGIRRTDPGLSDHFRVR